MKTKVPAALTPEQLRWRCDPTALNFSTTNDVDSASDIVGQETAREALEFGLVCDAPGQNVFVRGTRGTGRMSMVRRLLKQVAPVTEEKKDRCYVHNFERPDRPRLIELPAGQARDFKSRIKDVAEFVRDDLDKALGSEPYLSERSALQERIQQQIKTVTEPLEEDLKENGLALVSMQQGQATQTSILPVVDGQPVPFEQFQMLVAQGKVPKEKLEQIEAMMPDYQRRLQELGRQVSDTYRDGMKEVETLTESAARQLMAPLADSIVEDFPLDPVKTYVDEIVDDIINSRLRPVEGMPDPLSIYDVNVILCHDDLGGRPIIEESSPSAMNLLGTVEPRMRPDGMASSDFRGIRAGALLRADCGYLILDVHDVLTEPGAWASLMRTLRTGRLEIVPPEAGWMRPYAVVQPEAIEVSVRVIMVGDAATYYKLDQVDPDFRELFKVLADFDSEIERSNVGHRHYAAVVAHLAENESLPPFDRDAVGALIEHGARIVARGGKLTARFGRIADIAREAAFLSQQNSDSTVSADDVVEAIRRTRKRASLPSKKFQEMVNGGTIIVQTDGEVVGQINGLAVIRSGPLTYGFPARITATIGAGSAGLINIEGRAQMSGAIHTKGFQILGGLLRYLLKTGHPLAFSASIAFEQSYGGIDGDSASGAEACCLLSALTGIPIRQSFSMTGAIDQHGHIQAIGGVNEKVEGFFDACSHGGLNGSQGVIIPQSNAGDLMLREDVVKACSEGKFHVYAVSRIEQALALLTGYDVGSYGDEGYPADTLLGIAVHKAREFWKRTLSSPQALQNQANTDEDSSDPVVPSDRDESVPPHMPPEPDR